MSNQGTSANTNPNPPANKGWAARNKNNIIVYSVLAVVAILFLITSLNLMTTDASPGESSSTETSTETHTASRNQPASKFPSTRTEHLSKLISRTPGSTYTLLINEKIVLVLDVPKTDILHTGNFICNEKEIKDSDHTPPYSNSWVIEPLNNSQSFLTFTKL